MNEDLNRCARLFKSLAIPLSLKPSARISSLMPSLRKISRISLSAFLKARLRLLVSFAFWAKLMWRSQRVFGVAVNDRFVVNINADDSGIDFWPWCKGRRWNHANQPWRGQINEPVRKAQNAAILATIFQRLLFWTINTMRFGGFPPKTDLLNND